MKALLYRILQNTIALFPFIGEIRLGLSRSLAFLRFWHYVSRAKVKGDYLEFGVFQGLTFEYSVRLAKKMLDPEQFGATRFWAFDSFRGLPKPSPNHDDNTVWRESDYAASREVFENTIRGVRSFADVRVTEGLFKESLDATLHQEFRERKIAILNIDCDLYDSTLDALRFATPYLQNGTIIYFDDWFFSGGDMQKGEPGACAAWLKENPKIQLHDFGNVAIMGKAYLVQLPS